MRLTPFSGLQVITSTKTLGIEPESPHSPKYYAAAWKEYRRRIVTVPLLFAAFLVSPYIGYLLLRMGLPRAVPMLAIVGLMIAIGVSWVRVWQFPCPRCGELFRKLTSFWYGKNCAHCGLTKYGSE
ncbi:MAG: hypothetical protein L0Z53_18210 [Acidobacteriales bacterium]|nr:hypothetical protein [Terriglobales bacterium]